MLLTDNLCCPGRAIIVVNKTRLLTCKHMSNAHTRRYLHTFRQIGLKLIDLMALPLFIKAMPGKRINLKYMVKFLVKMIGKYSKCMLKKLSYHMYCHMQ